MNSGILGTPYLIIGKSYSICFFIYMARIARAVAPGIPHHITQRGNRRQQTFFKEPEGQRWSEPFIKKMEFFLDRKLKPQKPGPPKRKISKVSPEFPLYVIEQVRSFAGYIQEPEKGYQPKGM